MAVSEEDSQILARWKESSANMSPNIPIGVQVIKRGLIKDPVDRHYLLQEMVAATYRLRKTHEQYRKLCGQIAELHLREFPSMVEPLKATQEAWMTKVAGGGIYYSVKTFQMYATILTEAGEFEKAIAVCETAIRLGLSDNTAGGYEGRIDRIRKKAKKKATT
jgi:hypothetical protein